MPTFHEFTPGAAVAPGTVHTLNFPATCNAGDLLVCSRAIDGGVANDCTWPTGWTKLDDSHASTISGSLAWYVCTGTEGGTTFDVTDSESEQPAYCIGRWSGAASPPTLATPVIVASASASLDPGPVTIPQGDYGVAYFINHDNGTRTPTAHPTGYLNTGNINTGLGSGSGVFYGRQPFIDITSEDPDPATISTGDEAVVYTVAIADAAGADIEIANAAGGATFPVGTAGVVLNIAAGVTSGFLGDANDKLYLTSPETGKRLELALSSVVTGASGSAQFDMPSLDVLVSRVGLPSHHTFQLIAANGNGESAAFAITAQITLLAEHAPNAAPGAVTITDDTLLWSTLGVASPPTNTVGIPWFQYYTQSPLHDLMKTADAWVAVGGVGTQYAFNDGAVFDANGDPLSNGTETRFTCIVGDSVEPQDGSASGSLATLHTGVPHRLIWTGTAAPSLGDTRLGGGPTFGVADRVGSYSGTRHWAEFDLVAPDSAVLDLRNLDLWNHSEICLVPSSVASDYIVHPWDSGSTYKTLPLASVFKQSFLDFVAPWGGFRFMDAMNTNANANTAEDAAAIHLEVTSRSWGNTTTWPNTVSQRPVGQDGPVSPPWEFFFWMCSALSKSGWFNIPPRYAAHTATMLRFCTEANAHYTHADPLVIEPGNEGWNHASAFQNTLYLRDNGPLPALDILVDGDNYWRNLMGNMSHNSATILNYIRTNIAPLTIEGVLGVQTSAGTQALRTQFALGVAPDTLPAGPDYNTAWDGVAVSAYLGNSGTPGSAVNLFVDALAASITAGDTFATFRAGLGDSGVPAHPRFPDGTVITQAVAFDILDQELRDGSVAYVHTSTDTADTGFSGDMATRHADYALQKAAIALSPHLGSGLPLYVYEGNMHVSVIGAANGAVNLLEAYHQTESLKTLFAEFQGGVQREATPANHAAFVGWGSGWVNDESTTTDIDFFSLKRLFSDPSTDYPVYEAYLEAFESFQPPTIGDKLFVSRVGGADYLPSSDWPAGNPAYASGGALLRVAHYNAADQRIYGPESDHSALLNVLGVVLTLLEGVSASTADVMQFASTLVLAEGASASTADNMVFGNVALLEEGISGSSADNMVFGAQPFVLSEGVSSSTADVMVFTSASSEIIPPGFILIVRTELEI